MTYSTTLDGAVSADQTEVYVDDLPADPVPPYIQVGSELMALGPVHPDFVTIPHPSGRSRLAVERGVGGTARATHSDGAAVTGVTETSGGGGGGGVSVTDGTTTVAATSISQPAGTVVEKSAGVAQVLPAIFGATDPGAVGAGVFWVQKNAGQGFGQQLWVRNEDDDGWLACGPIIAMEYGEDSYSLASPESNQVMTFAEGSVGRIRISSFHGSNGNLDLTGPLLTLGGVPIGTQAAHVANGSTVDQLRDALIASGLMAAS